MYFIRFSYNSCNNRVQPQVRNTLLVAAYLTADTTACSPANTTVLGYGTRNCLVKSLVVIWRSGERVLVK